MLFTRLMRFLVAPKVVALIVSSGFAVMMLLFRMLLAGSATYGFLIWNLFLAWMPLVCLGLAEQIKRQGYLKIFVWILTVSWLFFFPNAPYLLTDLGHLARLGGWDVPLGYDVVMILAFTLNGLFLAFVSLFLMERIWAKLVGNVLATALSVSVLALAGFGMYLGRFLRWNTWDVVQRPSQLLGDIFTRLAVPLEHPQTWGFTLLYAGFLITIYIVVRLWLVPGKPAKPLHEAST